VSLFRVAASVVNGVGAAARALGVPAGRLDPAELERAASRSEGHDDFGDPRFRVGLETLVESLEADADLHMLGRLHMRALVIELLVTRLRLSRRLAQSRQRAPVSLTPPLLVCGLPRSGTTFLHRMLAIRSDARPLPLWELREPIPRTNSPHLGPGAPDPRLALAQARDRRIAELLPESVDAQHLMRAELPDECGHLFKVAFWSSLFWQVPVYRYLEWYIDADAELPYREYRALLDALAEPGRRLVLKDPFHAGHLESLLGVLPGAMVVQTHRDPVEIVPSFHKLTTTFQAVLSARVDRERTVELNTRWLQTLVRRSADARPRLEPGRVFDVDYRELVADPFTVVEAIHDHFGLDFDPAYRARLTQFIADNPQRKHGPNPYAASDFGQHRDQIAEAFADYRTRFQR